MTNEEFAQEFVDYIFINGNGDEARRLVLELPDGRNGGGWAKWVLKEELLRRLDKEYLAPLLPPPDK